MTRIKVLLVLFLLLVAIVVGVVVWFSKPTQTVQSWRLPDGSEISLAKVTYGHKHQVRYDHRWQDFLYPLFPAKVQSKFGSRVAMHTSSTSNAVVVWLWHRQIPAAMRGMGSSPRPNYNLFTVDENGVESERFDLPNCNYFMPKTGDTLSGWELEEYPRRSKQIGIRLYAVGYAGNDVLVAEFKIPNQVRLNYPVWVAEKLPALRKTNDLEISLLKLETGLATIGMGTRTAGKGGKAFSSGEFTMREHGQATEDWSITHIEATASSGEIRPLALISAWRDHKQVFGFTGALWLEEPAWKLKVEVSRTAHFPPAELWIVKHVPVPAPGRISEISAHTNMYGEEIELLSLSSPNTSIEELRIRLPDANLHARTPFPLSDAHLTLVEVRDDQGQKVETHGLRTGSSTGGRGATLRQMDYRFGINIPDGAKTLDVTFAFSQSLYVEFLAKPVMAEPAIKH